MSRDNIQDANFEDLGDASGSAIERYRVEYESQGVSRRIQSKVTHPDARFDPDIKIGFLERIGLRDPGERAIAEVRGEIARLRLMKDAADATSELQEAVEMTYTARQRAEKKAQLILMELERKGTEELAKQVSAQRQVVEERRRMTNAEASAELDQAERELKLLQIQYEKRRLQAKMDKLDQPPALPAGTGTATGKVKLNPAVERMMSTIQTHQELLECVKEEASTIERQRKLGQISDEEAEELLNALEMAFDRELARLDGQHS